MDAKLDKILILVTALIFIIGLLCLYSASFNKGLELSRSFVVKQFIWFALGLIPLVLVLAIEYQKLVDAGFVLYGLALMVLMLVLVLGRTIFGAQRWISIGGFSLQPSEFTKVIFIITLASYLGRVRIRILDIRSIFGALLITAVPFLLILAQPDLGTALMLVPILFAMLFAAGANTRHLLGLGICGFGVTPLFWTFLKEYQKQRLLVFLNPDIDPLGAGYTIIQSKIAIGSGGLLGKGWLSGSQNLLNFLPERHTDFIFSVVGEEWGFAGSAFLILLYFILIKRGFSIAQGTTEIHGKLIAVGVTTMLAFQIIVNICMTMGLMPVVGLPLPLMSYGGSSIWTTLICIGLLLNVKLRQTRF